MFMKFKIRSNKPYLDQMETRTIYLVMDSWNDFGYQTTYRSWILSDGKPLELGMLNIANIEDNERNVTDQILNTPMQKKCISLGSLGYYEGLIRLGKEIREDVLVQLQDIAYDLKKFKKYKDLEVVETSFLRGIKPYDVRNRYNRIATGTIENIYKIEVNRIGSSDFKLSLNVQSKSTLPTSIHALIGNNGSGKTKTLQGIADACSKYLNDELEKSTQNLKFSTNSIFGVSIESNSDSINQSEHPIEGIIYISYSPFDHDEDLIKNQNISFVGLNGYVSKENGKRTLSESMNKNLTKILEEEKINNEGKIENKTIVGSKQKMELWNEVIEGLSFDKNIMELKEYLLLDEHRQGYSKISETVGKLSAGQKILLLSFAHIINEAVEKTFIIIDEPELFLHPPLVTAYIRGLTKILSKTNSLCLLATHSPFVVQELPDECVHLLTRLKNGARINKPMIKTFGENISTINDVIFGTDMRLTGFYRLLIDLSNSDWKKANDLLMNKEMGMDAEAILRSVKMNKERRDGK